MSSQKAETAGTDQVADSMYIDSSQLSTRSENTAPGHDGSALAVLLKDEPGWLDCIRSLRETDVIILLTPIVNPNHQDPEEATDPFEPLGRALSKRHARIRQVPYTSRNGITSTHLGFIKRGQVIILCFVVSHDKSIQTEVADMTFAVSENKPCIIVVCHSPADTQHPTPFPAMIQTTGYSSPALEATAALIFGEQARAQPDRLPGSSSNLRQPGTWPVEQWNMARDISSTLQLWSDCVSDQFFLDEKTLASVLHRPGYAKHYVTRDPSSGEVLGFCATYLSYVNKEGEKLIGSIAILITRSTSRHRGIGLSLHNHAISQLKKTRGVVRVQLGSTFPRILYGPPSDMHFPDEWFCRRGWHLDRNTPGQGQAVYDLILSFSDWRYQKDARSVSPTFRSCTQAEMGNVLEIVQKTTFQEARMGWFDQYASLMNTPNVKDVVIGIEDDVIVAAALTYTPCCGSQIASNLPWAGRIADDMGGVCCICINRECFPFGCHAPGSRTFVKDLPNSSVAHKLAAENREKIIGGLLDACLVNLKSQGMEKMFIDGVVEALDTYTQLGFKKWAEYRDVWQDNSKL